MADDPELEALRQQRMAQLQQQMGGGGGEEQAKMRQQQQEMKNTILQQILDQNARARLNTIGMVNPEKQAQVEQQLIMMARSGQLPGKISEQMLVGLLEKMSGGAQASATKVKFDRRRAALDSDED